MAVIEIITGDGIVYTEPGEIKIERNEETEQFFKLLETFKAKEELGKETEAMSGKCPEIPI